MPACGCRWGFLGDRPCPEHYCGQPSEAEVEQWIMMEDRTPHPRAVWLERRAREVTGIARPVQALVDVDAQTVLLRNPVMGETWHADSHLTGRVTRGILDWDVVATVVVDHTGTVTPA